MKKVVLFAGVLLSIPLTTETSGRGSRRRSAPRGHHSSYRPTNQGSWSWRDCVPWDTTPAAQPAQQRPAANNDVNNAQNNGAWFHTGANGDTYNSPAPDGSANAAPLYASGTDSVVIPARQQPRPVRAQQPQQQRPQQGDWSDEDDYADEYNGDTTQQVIEAYTAMHLNKVAELAREAAEANQSATAAQLKAIAAIDRAILAETKLASLTQKPATAPAATPATQTTTTAPTQAPATSSANSSSSNPQPQQTDTPTADTNNGEDTKATWSTTKKVVVGTLSIGGIVLAIKALLGYCKQSKDQQNSLKAASTRLSADTQDTEEADDADTVSEADEEDTEEAGEDEEAAVY